MGSVGLSGYFGCMWVWAGKKGGGKKKESEFGDGGGEVCHRSVGQGERAKPSSKPNILYIVIKGTL